MPQKCIATVKSRIPYQAPLGLMDIRDYRSGLPQWLMTKLSTGPDSFPLGVDGPEDLITVPLSIPDTEGPTSTPRGGAAAN